MFKLTRPVVILFCLVYFVKRDEINVFGHFLSQSVVCFSLKVVYNCVQQCQYSIFRKIAQTLVAVRLRGGLFLVYFSLREAIFAPPRLLYLTLTTCRGK